MNNSLPFFLFQPFFPPNTFIKVLLGEFAPSFATPFWVALLFLTVLGTVAQGAENSATGIDCLTVFVSRSAVSVGCSAGGR